MAILSLVDAQAHLPELIRNLKPGDEIVITENDRPVARLVVEPPIGRRRRKAGSAKGILTIVHDDEEHLKDFAEYMP